MKLECQHCGKTLEIPEELSKALETINMPKEPCPVCSELLDRGVDKADLATHPSRPEVEKELEFQDRCSDLASVLTEETFPDHWREKKEEFKEDSRHDLAWEFFYSGALTAIALFAQAEKKGCLNDLLEPLLDPELK